MGIIKKKTKKQYMEICNFIMNEYNKDLKFSVKIDNRKEPFFGKVSFNRREIIMKQNILRLSSNKDKHIYNTITYLNRIINVDCNIDNDPIFIFIFLHELGHVDLILKYIEMGLTKSDIIKLKQYEKILYSRLIKDCKKLKRFTIFESYCEKSADLFAYKQFPIMWDKLKTAGYVK